MPNRVLRDWTASDKIDQLSPGAEVFFTRLIMKADDYGLYYGNPKLLNSALFPLRDYDNGKVSLWLTECVKAGIIQKYTVDGKDYIHILGFDQRLRLMKSKFPAPPETAKFTAPSNDGQMTDNGRPETKRNETEVETETESEGACAQVCVWPTFDDFWDKYDKKVGKPNAEKLFKKIDQGGREKIMVHLDHYLMTEKQYRKDPERYLKHKTWEDEIITKQQNGHSKNGQQSTEELARAFEQRVKQDFASGEFQASQ